MKPFARLLIVAPPLLFASSVLAQHQTFTVSPETSNVGFTLGGSGHETHGTFHVQNGSIHFDPANQKLSSSVVVAAGGGKTGNDSRDKKMTNEVLDAPHFADVSLFRNATRAQSLRLATRRYKSRELLRCMGRHMI